MTKTPDVMYLMFERGLYLSAFVNPDAAQRTKEARERGGHGPIEVHEFRRQPVGARTSVRLPERIKRQCRYCGKAAVVYKNGLIAHHKDDAIGAMCRASGTRSHRPLPK